MKKISITIFVFCVIIILGFFLTAESYFAPYPYISTKFTSNFSWEKWSQVQNGMSKSEVHNLLGNPFSNFISSKASLKSGENFENCETYSDESNYTWFAWIKINICYDNNEKVYGKNELIMYN